MNNIKTIIIWFRNDLRISDNKTISTAIEQNCAIVPVYVFDDKWFSTDKFGHIKTGAFRLKFLLESLADLKSELKKRGSNLLIGKGNTNEIIKNWAEKYEADEVWATKAYTQEEIDIEDSINNNITTRYFEQSTLIKPNDLPFSINQLDNIFTNFRKKIEKTLTIHPLLATPEKIESPNLNESMLPTFEDFNMLQPTVDSRTAFPFLGGAKNGLERLNFYLNQHHVASYKKTRNGLIGENYSSKFSAWLANGSLSPREIYWAVKEYEKSVTKNQSTYWMIFELLWRDYFYFIAMKYGQQIFHLKGLKSSKTMEYAVNDEADFSKWKEGKTKHPFINANMIELAYTGWMSNRGRQNVASYLAHHLKIDWRKGASWFEHCLIDYDPCVNTGNWLYVAGVGNDPRPNRVFNPDLQAKRYDGDGEFVKLWL